MLRSLGCKVRLSVYILVKLMKKNMEFHEMDVTGRYNFYSC